MELILQKANTNLEEAFFEFIKEWEDNKEEIIPYAVRLLDMNYKEWLEYTNRIEKENTCPIHLVPAYTYFLIQNKKIIGAINIRHRLNDYLLNYGGHIGYGIRPSERKKGFASLMLKMALPIVKELGLKKVLITCDKNNIGSSQTIINNGGILENEVDEDGSITQRYWITL